MTDDQRERGRDLVAAVRDAAAAHQTSWETLVPNQFVVNLEAERAEEIAYSDMARAKAALRDHICDTYGLSLRELCSLAHV
jgi:hypothetical protein